MVDMDPVAMAVKKDKPPVTNLPHVRKVIDEAPPEYIIMVVVAFLQVFAMTISLVHILNKHRAFTRLKPGMVCPTMAILSFYWVIAALNLIGLVVLRANLLCQTICSCYDALIGYLFAVLLVSYANGKLSYLTMLRWRDVTSSQYSCSTICCWTTVTQNHAQRGVSYVAQLIVIHFTTSLAELICENEGLYFYPSPITKSYIVFGLKTVQFVSLLFALYGFMLLCRAASIVAPRTSPFIKLLLFKCIYILAAVQNNVFLYLAYNRILPAVSDIAPVTRAVVWANFAAVLECTFAYFVAVRMYRVEDYSSQTGKTSNLSRTLERVEQADAFYRSTFESDKKPCGDQMAGEMSDSDERFSLPEMELDKQDMINLKFIGLKIDGQETVSLSSFNLGLDEANFGLDEATKSKKGKLRKGTCRSVDTMLAPVKQKSTRTKSARMVQGAKYATVDFSKVREEEEEEEDEGSAEIEPKISIVGGKVNISLSSKDLVKLCKSSTNATDTRKSIPINLSLEDLLDEEKRTSFVEEERTKCQSLRHPEKARVTFGDTNKSRHSMQFIRSFSYSQLNSSEDEDVEGSEGNEDLCGRADRTNPDPSQYVSKISLV